MRDDTMRSDGVRCDGVKDDREKKIYDLWLDCLWECSPKKKHQLIQTFGTSFDAWKDGRNLIETEMKSASRQGGGMATPEEARRLLERLEQQKIRAIAWDDEEFPPLLKEITNPPWMIYVAGNAQLLSRPCVAVIGARRASQYGKNVAYHMGKRLAQAGAVVVSGMAMGIDSCAHRGALDNESGRSEEASTIAVLGGGVDVCYPASNRQIYDEIRKRGALVSEFQPGVHPKNYYFPMRNRLISGLSEAAVVVEAAIGSGSLITAELAAEQGREVFAIPGNIDRIGSVGTNKLIKDGASLLISVEDLIHELGLEADEPPESDEQLGADEKKIIKILLQQGEVTADQLAASLGLPTSKINGLVTVLEMKGIISTAIGKIFLAKKFENLYNMPL